MGLNISACLSTVSHFAECSLSELKEKITNLHHLLDWVINLSGFHGVPRVTYAVLSFSRAPTVIPNIKCAPCSSVMRRLSHYGAMNISTFSKPEQKSHIHTLSLVLYLPEENTHTQLEWISNLTRRKRRVTGGRFNERRTYKEKQNKTYKAYSVMWSQKWQHASIFASGCGVVLIEPAYTSVKSLVSFVPEMCVRLCWCRAPTKISQH